MAGESAMIIKSATAIVALGGAMWAGIVEMDKRYELQEVHGGRHATMESSLEKISYQLQKRDIRELRELVHNETDDDRRRRLLQELEEAIDMLCHDYPKDRECLR